MTTNRLGFLLLLLAALAFALAGCGGGGGGGSSEPDPDPDPDPGPGNAQYDMTGDWLIVVRQRSASSLDDWDEDDVFVATVTQSGSTVSLPASDGGPAIAGTVDGSIYDLGRSYPDSGGTTTETIHFDLQSEDEGTGDVTWEWTDGGTVATGSGELLVYRVLPPEQSLTGDWDFVVAPGFSDPEGEESDPEQGTVTLTVTGNEVTLVAPDTTLNGYVTGPHVWLTRSGPEDGGQSVETIRLFFGDPDNGGGEIFWRWWDSTTLIVGQDNLNLTRAP